MNYHFIPNDFITTDFIKIVRDNVINVDFPELNTDHQNLLEEYLLYTVDIIYIKFNQKKDSFRKQLIQNNYRDLRGLLYILIPFIDDEDGSKKKNLRSLNELYIKKEKDDDINKTSPRYIYTNIQYGRCNRMGSDGQIHEISFDKEHIYQNFALLKQTIQTVANKLYVNWIDIRPYKIDYNNSLSKSTLEVIKNHTWGIWDPCKRYEDYDDNDKMMRLYNGIDISDIYNILSNNYYYIIKQHKWIIYDTPVYSEDEIPLPFIIALNSIIPLDNCNHNIEWNNISVDERILFKERWNDIVYNRSSQWKIRADTVSRILKSLMIFFNNHYSKLSEAISNEEYIPFEFKRKNDDDSEREIDISIETIYTSIKSVNPKHIYTYIKEVLNIIRPSTYYRKINSYDGKILDIDNFKSRMMVYYYNNIQHMYTFKNIYNLSKSFVHRMKNNKFTPLPKYWISLTQEDKEDIIKKINTDYEYGQEWFNISSYIKKTYLYNINIKEKNKQIYEAVYLSIITQITEDLMSSGIFSEFIPTPEVTDLSGVPDNDADIKRHMQSQLKKFVLTEKNIQSWNDEFFYYLTNKKYKDLDPIYEKTDSGYKKISYLEKLSNSIKGTWHDTYAMNWVSQLQFYHKYMHSRILYVTGSTGVGKSTQIPKLLLYSLKMINYIPDGRVICSQPRIAPTTGNSIWISKQMGTPIKNLNHYLDKEIRTTNYSLQYKYKEDSHDVKMTDLSLKIVTDGTLYQELKGSLLFKKKIKGRECKLNYTTIDKYHIVIVDEAHEHNANMDLILTFMKYATYYNNNLKLVIISATMDDDEPVYRRYYRDINDNRMHPVNQSLKQHNLDRVNVDRRVHISPPGKTTQFKITDIYTPEVDPVQLIIKEIINVTQEGDILLFQPGRAEISKAVTTLNKSTPPNTIAIPYHTQMSTRKKETVENIDKNIRKFDIDKSVVYDDEYDEQTVKRVPQGTYKRVIIVATNIAEASITISSLRYVVETGNQKVNYYDYKNRTSELRLEKRISESSRKQRRGRVGRVASGTVYYIYPEGTMVDSKQQFNISISDISENIADMLQESYIENPLFDNSNDPNNISQFDKITSDTVKNMYSCAVDEMIVEQYFDNDKLFSYYGNDTQYDYNNNVPPHTYYSTGFSKDTIFDIKGTFYIVHPDELCLKRNIIGDIVQVDSTGPLCDGVEMDVPSKKIQSFMNSLTEQYVVLSDGDNYIKTKFGADINKFKQELKIVDFMRDVVVYIYSRRYGCDKEIVKLLSILYIIGGNGISTLIDRTGNYSDNVKQIHSTYKDKTSDLNSLLRIVDDILNFIDINIFKVKDMLDHYDDDGKALVEYKDWLTIQKKEYIKNKDSGDYSKIHHNILDILIKMEGKGVLENTDTVSQDEINETIKYDFVVKHFMEAVNNNSSILKKWCENNHLNYDKTLYIAEFFVKLANNISKYQKKLYDIDYDEDDLSVDLEVIESYVKINSLDRHIHSNITSSFIHGYSFNIAKKLYGTRFFVLIKDPSINNLYEINSYKGFKYVPDKFFEKDSEYIMFIQYGKDNTISVGTYIDPKHVQNTIAYTYMPQYYLPENYDVNWYKKYIDKLNSSMQSKKYSINTKNYMNLVNDIKKDMLNSYNHSIWDSVGRLDGEEPREEFISLLVRQRNLQNRIYNSERTGLVGGYTRDTDCYNMNCLYIRYLVDKN